MEHLYIDEDKCTISEVRTPVNGWSEVFVNSYSSRHWLPADLARFEHPFHIHVSGHTYQYKRD